MSGITNVLNVFMHRKYESIVKAKGIYLYTKEGREIIDASGGPILCSLGHGIEEMAKALYAQAKAVAFAYRFDFTSPPLEEASTKLCEAGNGTFKKVFFVSGGSEATEIAVKLARVYHIDRGNQSKFRVISRWQGYHGNTMGALAWSGHTARRKLYQPYLTQDLHIPPAYCYRCWYNKDPKTCNYECARALEDEIQVQGPESIAAFIAEPVSGMSLCGANPPEKYFQIIKGICEKYDVLLIMDEVMTGVGRTGKYFAYEHYGVTPDIVAMGKALSGGYFPIGAAACTQHVYDEIEKKSGTFAAGYSWVGNPLGAAVTAKALDYLKEHNLVEQCAQRSAYLVKRLETLRSHPTVGDIRGKGLMVGIEFVKDKGTKEPLDPSINFNLQLAHESLEQGMFLEAGAGCDRGQRGDMVMFGPPFTVTEKEIDKIVDIFDSVLTKVEKKAGF